jgi:hypothetical protein
VQVVKADAERALAMLKKMAEEPSMEGTAKLSKTAMIPLDFLKRCKVKPAPETSCTFYDRNSV